MNESGWWERAKERRARRAIERQLDYQVRKAGAIRGQEGAMSNAMRASSEGVRDRLAAVRPITAAARVLEVGSGAHGLIFSFEGRLRIGIDPLAVEYSRLFPWQGRARTIAAFGERLPFRSGAFDVVLCDNVVDHAEDPRKIIEEMARVLAPGGLLYFTVNVHHPVYGLASDLHGMWNAVGLRLEISAFADHTTHLTPGAARQLFDAMPLRLLSSSTNISEASRRARLLAPRHAGDLLKRVFFKNALFETIAVKSALELGTA